MGTRYLDGTISTALIPMPRVLITEMPQKGTSALAVVDGSASAAWLGRTLGPIQLADRAEVRDAHPSPEYENYLKDQKRPAYYHCRDCHEGTCAKTRGALTFSEKEPEK